MANVNKVFLIGNLTRDPELRYTPSQVAVTDLGLAINRYYTTKDGERREEVLFIDVTVWNRQAENCCQYLKKGQPVHVEGYLRMDSWDDRNTGEKRTKIKVEAENVQFLGSRREGGAPGGAPEEEFSPTPRRSAPAESRGPANGSSRPSAPSPMPPPRRPAQPEPEEADEDIPF
jgi:single-strand DNA-binding protein